ncbi:MAG: hypothetical protein JO040_10380 [Gemmatimonadetes bacterium]|nr:hypothetical protein [Gemmatimonadota bacterium]
MEEKNGRPGEEERLATILPLHPPEPRAGCGVTGCLTVAAIGFVLLLLAMVGLALTRTWSTPVAGY